MARRFHVAVIGLGRLAKDTHFWNIQSQPQLELKYVVEQDITMAREFLKECYRDDIIVLSPEDVGQVYEDSSIDAIIILSSTNTHEDYIKSSVNAGKAVFCEKPIALDVASAKSCYEAAKKNGKSLFCAFNRRFDPSIQSLHQRVKAGEIDQIKNIRIFNRDHKVRSIEFLKTSGGIFADSAIHELDLVCWFMGALPSTVYVQGHAWHEKLHEFGDADHVVAVMKYPTGAIVSIDSGRFTAYGNDHRVEIHGTNGVCIQQCPRYPTSITKLGGDKEERESGYRNTPDLWKEAFQAELQHFVNVLQGKEELLVTEEECLNTARLISACNESLKTGLPVNVQATSDQNIVSCNNNIINK